jgi:hypothetical protein
MFEMCFHAGADRSIAKARPDKWFFMEFGG